MSSSLLRGALLRLSGTYLCNPVSVRGTVAFAIGSGLTQELGPAASWLSPPETCPSEKLGANSGDRFSCNSLRNFGSDENRGSEPVSEQRNLGDDRLSGDSNTVFDGDRKISPNESDVDACFELICKIRPLPPAKLRYNPDDGRFLNTLWFALRWLNSVATSKILARIDRDFEQEEFKEGLTDAFFMVNSLLSSSDFKTLEPMVSPQLLGHFQSMHSRCKDLGLRWQVEVDQVDAVEVRGVVLAREHELRHKHPKLLRMLPGRGGEDAAAEAEAGGEAGPATRGEAVGASLWLLVHVSFCSRERWRAVQSSSGRSLREAPKQRQSLWWFARGPIGLGDHMEPLDSLPISLDGTRWLLISTGQ